MDLPPTCPAYSDIFKKEMYPGSRYRVWICPGVDLPPTCPAYSDFPDRTSVLPMGECWICREECRVGVPPLACTCRWEVCEPCFADWVRTSWGECVICHKTLRPDPLGMTDLRALFRKIIVDVGYFAVVLLCYWALSVDPDHLDITRIPEMYVISRLLMYIAARLPEKIQTHWIINDLILDRSKVSGRLWAGSPVFLLWQTIFRTIAEGTFGPYDMFTTGVAVAACLVALRWIPVHRRHSLTFSPDRVE